MKPRNILFSILFLALVASAAFAQRDSSMITRRVEALTTALSLTPEQVTKVRALYTKEFTESANLREKYQDDREGMQKARRERQQKLDEQLLPLLTSEQKTKYEQFKKERQGGRMGRPPGSGN
jgi:protein CpxP